MLVSIALLYIVLIVCSMAYVAWCAGELWLAMRGVPPFVRTREAVAVEAAAVFGVLPQGSVLYDLGCGDGRVLRALARANPQAMCVGIEMRRIPYHLAQLKQARAPLPNVSFRRGDFYAMDFSDATHFYTYLYPEVMRKLLPKLHVEAPGAALVSLDFAFATKEPERMIPVRSPGKLGREFYLYTL